MDNSNQFQGQENAAQPNNAQQNAGQPNAAQVFEGATGQPQAAVTPQHEPMLVASIHERIDATTGKVSTMVIVKSQLVGSKLFKGLGLSVKGSKTGTIWLQTSADIARTALPIGTAISPADATWGNPVEANSDGVELQNVYEINIS